VVTQFVENATQGSRRTGPGAAVARPQAALPGSLDRSKYEHNAVTTEQLVADFTDDAQKAYDTREEALTPDVNA